MTEEQKVHIAMINSFNILTGKVDIDEVMESDVPYLSYHPSEFINMNAAKFILSYFMEREMYEHCGEFQQFIDETFNKDGTPKEKTCECEMPDIKEYTKKTTCTICNLRLKIW